MRAIGRLLVTALMLVSAASASAADISVYKSASCGCCSKWVRYLEANGFKVNAYDVDNVYSYKDRYKVPEPARGCHTAVVDGYVIEGHVPVSDIERLVKERPEGVIGLAVPGMPAGTPGMDDAGSQHYEVLSIKQDGTTAVYARH